MMVGQAAWEVDKCPKQGGGSGGGAGAGRGRRAQAKAAGRGGGKGGKSWNKRRGGKP